MRGGGLGSGAVALVVISACGAAGTEPASPADTDIGATDFSWDPAAVDTVETDSPDWRGAEQPHEPITGPPISVWCRMQHACAPPAPPTPLAHGNAATAGTPLKCSAMARVRRRRTRPIFTDVAGKRKPEPPSQTPAVRADCPNARMQERSPGRRSRGTAPPRTGCPPPRPPTRR